jgi:hypothetical protein
MTIENEIKEHHEKQAEAKLEVISKLNIETCSQISKGIIGYVKQLEEIIKWDTAELCIFRQLEGHAINGTLTPETTNEIFKELKDLREELGVRQKEIADKIPHIMTGMQGFSFVPKDEDLPGVH